MVDSAVNHRKCSSDMDQWSMFSGFFQCFLNSTWTPKGPSYSKQQLLSFRGAVGAVRADPSTAGLPKLQPVPDEVPPAGRLGTLGLAMAKMMKNSEQILVKMVVYHSIILSMLPYLSMLHHLSSIINGEKHI